MSSEEGTDGSRSGSVGRDVPGRGGLGHGDSDVLEDGGVDHYEASGGVGSDGFCSEVSGPVLVRLGGSDVVGGSGTFGIATGSVGYESSKSGRSTVRCGSRGASRDGAAEVSGSGCDDRNGPTGGVEALGGSSRTGVGPQGATIGSFGLKGATGGPVRRQSHRRSF